MNESSKTEKTLGRPLEGLVVADLTRILAGPFATLNLAHLGAKVIKVETPHGGDDSRSFPPFKDDSSLYFSSINYDKYSIALDLKKQDDKKIFEKLLAKSDFLVENYRPGTMEKLGYAWDDLKQKYPQLIYGSLSGFGLTGPMAAMPAYDLVVQALGGVMSLTGHPGQPPVRVRVSIGDLASGLYFVIALQAALVRRMQGHGGSRIDIAMLDCQVAMLEGSLTNYLSTGAITESLGSRHYSIAPFQAYRTKDSYMILAGGNDRLFVQACEVLQRMDLVQDERFKSNQLRCQHVDVLEVEIEKTLAAKTTEEWVKLFDEKGVPSAPIQNVSKVATHPQVNARNMIVDIKDPVFGNIRTGGNPIKMTGIPDEVEHRGAPSLDQDRSAILQWLDQP
jgi:CoA:oxalate CoA-transferase